jgi:hypothetical protein
MTDAFPPRPASSDPDGPPRPPTFVQIRPPAAPASAWQKLGVLSVGLALVTILGWGFYRVTDKRDAPAVTKATLAVTAHAPSSTPPVSVDFYADLERRAIDTAASAPAWSRESLMDRVSPFDVSASDRVPSRAPSDAPPADTTDDGSREVSVRLAKGETIGSALQKLGLASDVVADVISALAAHVSLNRLPTGLGMTAQIRPAVDGGAKPILEMLTLHPTGRQTITIERDAKGKYAVEQRRR